jgi:hypothetical protein
MAIPVEEPGVKRPKELRAIFRYFLEVLNYCMLYGNIISAFDAQKTHVPKWWNWQTR